MKGCSITIYLPLAPLPTAGGTIGRIFLRRNVISTNARQRRLYLRDAIGDVGILGGRMLS